MRFLNLDNKGMMPVRWMPPESIRDGVAISASDVWSFGIVLWEMVTLAELPYRGLSNYEVIESVVRGKINDRPEGCPDDLYEMMKKCWIKDFTQRPTFLDLCHELLPFANERFKTTSFFTSKEGQGAFKELE